MRMLDYPALLLWALGLTLYGAGWIRLRLRGARNLASWGRGGLGLLAFAVMGAALLPPWAEYAERSFLVHMLEHEALVELGPVFLWLSRPFPIWLWGLPAAWRRGLARRFFLPNATWRARLQAWTRPQRVVPLYILLLSLWHLPLFHDATRQWWGMHTVEHLSLMAVALLFWWMVLSAAPRWHVRGRSSLPLMYIIVAYVQNQFMGLSITLLRRPMFALDLPANWPLSPLADQALGGAMMWIPGEMIYTAVLMGLLIRFLEEPRPYHGIFRMYEEEDARQRHPLEEPYLYLN